MIQTLPSAPKNFSASNASFSQPQTNAADFEVFYDKYSPAFYGEIKKRLRNEEVSQKVMKDACVKIYQSLALIQQAKEKPFIAAFKVVRSEISRTKVDIALNQILYSQMQRRRQVAI